MELFKATLDNDTEAITRLVENGTDINTRIFNIYFFMTE